MFQGCKATQFIQFSETDNFFKLFSDDVETSSLQTESIPCRKNDTEKIDWQLTRANQDAEVNVLL